MSRLIDRGMLFNALSQAHDQAKVFEIIQGFPTVDMNADKIEEIKTEMCDHYCRFVYSCKTEEELMVKCKTCPINELDYFTKNWTV